MVYHSLVPVVFWYYLLSIIYTIIIDVSFPVTLVVKPERYIDIFHDGCVSMSGLCYFSSRINPAPFTCAAMKPKDTEQPSEWGSVSSASAIAKKNLLHNDRRCDGVAP